MNNPVFLMLTIIYTFCIVFDPGQLGVDTSRRLQVAHWLWADTEPLLPEEYPIDKNMDNIAIGANGRAHYGYGIGQSLIMLPADLIGTIVSRSILNKSELSLQSKSKINTRIRILAVSYIMFPLISVITAFVLYQTFINFGLESWPSIGAVFLSLGATRWFDMVHVHQESGLRFLCLLSIILLLDYSAKIQRAYYSILIGILAFLMIVTTITSIIEISIVIFWFSVFLIYDNNLIKVYTLKKTYIWLLAFSCLGLVADRAYQYVRFGELTSTYAGLYFKRISELRQHGVEPLNGIFNNPEFPWTNSFWKGVVGAIVSPEWGMLWFDSLVVLSMYLLVRNFNSLSSLVKMYLYIGVSILAVDIAFYARYYEPAGWTAWGDRYTEVPAVLLSVIAAFMLFKVWRLQSILERFVCFLVIAEAVIAQLVSGFFSPNLEIIQRIDGCGSNWIIMQRILNIKHLFSGLGAGHDCLPPDLQWSWEPFVFPGTLTRVMQTTSNQNYLIWTVWTCGVVFVIALILQLLKTWRRTASSVKA